LTVRIDNITSQQRLGLPDLNKKCNPILGATGREHSSSLIYTNNRHGYFVTGKKQAMAKHQDGKYSGCSWNYFKST